MSYIFYFIDTSVRLEPANNFAESTSRLYAARPARQCADDVSKSANTASPTTAADEHEPNALSKLDFFSS